MINSKLKAKAQQRRSLAELKLYNREAAEQINNFAKAVVQL